MIRKLQSGDQLLLEKYLLGRVETSMFMLGNLRSSGVDYRDASCHGEYFGCFANAGELNGVLVHYWNGIIMMQAAEPTFLHPLKQAGSFASTADILAHFSE